MLKKGENRESNDHLVFKIFTSNSNDRTDVPPKHVKIWKSLTPKFENPRGEDEHHETPNGNFLSKRSDRVAKVSDHAYGMNASRRRRRKLKDH
jgi:hypothetical protein